MKRRIALVAFAVAAVAALGLGLNARGASAAPGLQANPDGPYTAWRVTRFSSTAGRAAVSAV